MFKFPIIKMNLYHQLFLSTKFFISFIQDYKLLMGNDNMSNILISKLRKQIMDDMYNTSKEEEKKMQFVCYHYVYFLFNFFSGIKMPAGRS